MAQIIVVSKCKIPRGCMSSAFQTDDIICGKKNYANQPIYVESDDKLRIDFIDSEGNEAGHSWVSSMKLAGDIQSAHLELERDNGSPKPKPQWRLRAVKDIDPNKEMELWFSEEIIAQLNIPFLTPRNIKGRKNYHCHVCGHQFEQPNPLKIHLYMSCQQTSLPRFWSKFLQAYSFAFTPLNLSIGGIVQHSPSEKIQNTLFRPGRDEHFSKGPDYLQNPRCFSEPPFSAFQPYGFRFHYPATYYPQFNNNLQLSLSTANYLPHSRSPLPSLKLDVRSPHLKTLQQIAWSSSFGTVGALSKSLDQINVKNAVEVETFATNWGKSTEGHLCIYCGKIYSRKYGLKIHIRTHTGYKPLQCQYCLRPFGDPSNLNKHVRLHAQSETPYCCNICGKMLVRKRDLERHLKSRHADDPETINVAGQNTDSSDDNN